MTDIQREQIIDVASKMFVTEGLKAVRMDDIAHRTGISKRTLYEAFGDKEELIYLAMDYHFNRIEEENIRVASKATNIIVALLLITKQSISNSEQNWLLINSLKRFYPSILKRIQSERQDRQRRDFMMGLEDGVQQGLLNPEANLDLAISMLHYIAISVINDDSHYPLPDGISPQVALSEMTIYFLRGISTPLGIEQIEKYLKSIEK